MLTISSCYCSTPLSLVLIRRNSGLSTLCHSCRFACQQRVLKTVPGPGYLHSGDGVLWLWHSLVYFYMYIQCHWGFVLKIAYMHNVLCFASMIMFLDGLYVDPDFLLYLFLFIHLLIFVDLLSIIDLRWLVFLSFMFMAYAVVSYYFWCRQF